jgi:hypothetical protein
VRNAAERSPEYSWLPSAREHRDPRAGQRAEGPPSTSSALGVVATGDEIAAMQRRSPDSRARSARSPPRASSRVRAPTPPGRPSGASRHRSRTPPSCVDGDAAPEPPAEGGSDRLRSGASRSRARARRAGDSHEGAHATTRRFSRVVAQRAGRTQRGRPSRSSTLSRRQPTAGSAASRKS